MYRHRVTDVETDVSTALAGRPLVAPEHRTRGRCRRCVRKNDVRERLGLDDAVRSPVFEDGDRVVLTAVAADADDAAGAAVPREQRWSVTAAYHRDHPQRAREAVARRGTVQARLAATLRAEGWMYRVPRPQSSEREYDPDALVLRAVETEWVSPADEGRPPESDGVGGTDPSEPRDDWPPAENAWRRRLVARHGES